MVSLAQWTWVWINSGSWWWIGKSGVLQSMGLQRVGHQRLTELNWTDGHTVLEAKGQNQGVDRVGSSWSCEGDCSWPSPSFWWPQAIAEAGGQIYVRLAVAYHEIGSEGAHRSEAGIWRKSWIEPRKGQGWVGTHEWKMKPSGTRWTPWSGHLPLHAQWHWQPAEQEPLPPSCTDTWPWTWRGWKMGTGSSRGSRPGQ